jgi:hypothetical protein
MKQFPDFLGICPPTAIKLSLISSLLPAACPQDPEDLCKIAGFRGQSRGTLEKAKSLNLMAVICPPRTKTRDIIK